MQNRINGIYKQTPNEGKKYLIIHAGKYVYRLDESRINNSPRAELISEVDARETTVRREDGKFIVEGEWLFNFMGQINFSYYESLGFFQRVLVKNGVIDLLRKEGIEEGDTADPPGGPGN